MFVSLKPLGANAGVTADQVIARLRGKLVARAGRHAVLQPVQDLRIGGRPSAAQYQYTLQGDDLEELFDWAPRMLPATAPAAAS